MSPKGRILPPSSILLAVLLLLALARAAIATEYVSHWIGTSNGSWNDPANWDPAIIPNNTTTDTFDVIWDQKTVTISIDQPITIRDLTLKSPGTLTGNADLIIQRSFTWFGGGPMLRGSGKTIVQSNAEILPGIIQLDRILELEGSTQLSADVYFQSPAAHLRNKETGVLQISSGSLNNFNSAADIENFGIIRFLPSATDYSSRSTFSNKGRVEIHGRTVSFHGVFTQESGELFLNGGKTLDYLHINAGSVGGTGELAGGLSLGTAAFIGGTATLSGNLTVGHLGLDDTAKVRLHLGGRVNGEYDSLTVNNWHGRRPAEVIEIEFVNNFETAVRPADIFNVLNISQYDGGTSGQPPPARIPTLEGFGTFSLEAAPNQPSVVLRDFRPLAGPSMTVAPEPIYVSFSFAQQTHFADSAAIVTAPPNFNWDGVTLDVTFTAEHVTEPSFHVTGNDPVSGFAMVDVDELVSPARIHVTFNANATTEQVQNLLRRIVFDSRLDRETYVTGGPPPSLGLQFQLKAPSGAQAITSKTVIYPLIEEFFSDPRTVVIFGGGLGNKVEVTYKARFSNGTTITATDFIDSEAEVTTSCPQLLEAQFPAGSPSSSFKLEAISMNAAQCELRVHGVITPVFISDACLVRFLAIFSLIFNRQSPLASDLDKKIAMRRSPQDSLRDYFQSGGQPLSLATFHGLEALMKQTDEGKRLAQLYREHSPELVQMVGTNETLSAQVALTVLEFQPAVVALLSGRAAQSTMTEAMINRLNQVWTTLAASASPALKTALDSERQRFDNFQTFIGKNFNDWATTLQIPAPAAPTIYLSKPVRAQSSFSAEANLLPNAITLQRATDFGAWEPVSGFLITTNGFTLNLTDPNPHSSQYFYRATVQP